MLPAVRQIWPRDPFTHVNVKLTIGKSCVHKNNVITVDNQIMEIVEIKALTWPKNLNSCELFDGQFTDLREQCKKKLKRIFVFIASN